MPAKSKIFLLTVFALTCSRLIGQAQSFSSQGQPVRTFTLEQAIDYAVTNYPGGAGCA